MTHTHHLSTNDQVVTKTYASWSRNEPAREWAALQTIAAALPTGRLAAERKFWGLLEETS